MPIFIILQNPEIMNNNIFSFRSWEYWFHSCYSCKLKMETQGKSRSTKVIIQSRGWIWQPTFARRTKNMSYIHLIDKTIRLYNEKIHQQLSSIIVTWIADFSRIFFPMIRLSLKPTVTCSCFSHFLSALIHPRLDLSHISTCINLPRNFVIYMRKLFQ